jgi:hypothetical protein
VAGGGFWALALFNGVRLQTRTADLLSTHRVSGLATATCGNKIAEEILFGFTKLMA